MGGHGTKAKIMEPRVEPREAKTSADMALETLVAKVMTAKTKETTLEVAKTSVERVAQLSSKASNQIKIVGDNNKVRINGDNKINSKDRKAAAINGDNSSKGRKVVISGGNSSKVRKVVDNGANNKDNNLSKVNGDSKIKREIKTVTKPRRARMLKVVMDNHMATLRARAMETTLAARVGVKLTATVGKHVFCAVIEILP